jgi:hypothetical protein
MKKNTNVRALHEADQTYAAALELRNSLRTRLANLESEESDLHYNLANSPASAWLRTNRVAELLGDVPDPAAPAPDGLRKRMTELFGERNDLRLALDEANQRLSRARGAASRAICTEVADDYAARVKALAATLITAHSAHADLLDLIDKLNRNDIAWVGSLPPMQAYRIFGDKSERVARWLKEASTAGFIDKKNIPTELEA